MDEGCEPAPDKEQYFSPTESNHPQSAIELLFLYLQILEMSHVCYGKGQIFVLNLDSDEIVLCSSIILYIFSLNDFPSI